jgi:hypothetical protein
MRELFGQISIGFKLVPPVALSDCGTRFARWGLFMVGRAVVGESDLTGDQNFDAFL